MSNVELQDGGGGTAMGDLLSRILTRITVRNVRGGIGLDEMDDGGTIPLNELTLVFTTDSYTVKPLFFNGGDIGKLSMCGTINDISVMGAKPLALSAAFVIGEGFPITELERIMDSINAVLEEVNVPLITGDTKVIEVDGSSMVNTDTMIITTTGLGTTKEPVRDSTLAVGDKIIINGTIGDHGIAILSQREGIEFETKLESDCAPLYNMIEGILDFEIHAMKDPTRGGVASALNDMAQKSSVGIVLDENKIPIKKEVRSASEMLGIDPLSVANEGKVIIGVGADDAGDVLEKLRGNRYGRDAQIIGEVTEDNVGCEDHVGRVTVRTVIGGRRILEMPAGDPVPRVC